MKTTFWVLILVLLWPSMAKAEATAIDKFSVTPSSIEKGKEVKLKVTINEFDATSQHFSFLWALSKDEPNKDNLCLKIKEERVVYPINGLIYLSDPTREWSWTVDLDPGQIMVIAALMDTKASSKKECTKEKTRAVATVSLTITASGGGNGNDGGNDGSGDSQKLGALPLPKIQNPTNFKDIGAVLTATVDWLLALGGLVGFVILFWGGLQYITAGGNEEKSSKAKNAILGAIIGIILIGSALAIINYVTLSIK